jgi:hypothetical protein
MGNRHVETPDAGTEPPRGGARRLALVLTVAAAVVLAIAGWLMTSGDDTAELVPANRSTDSTPAPSTEKPTSNTTASTMPPEPSSPVNTFPTAVPEAPDDPTTNFPIVALVQRDGILGILGRDSTEQFFPLDGEFALPEGVLGEQRILDTASGITSSYEILCCDPGPSLWRNGRPSTVAATRIQFVFGARWPYVAVDDVGDTLSVSDGGNLGDIVGATVSVPGIIDAAADSERLIALVAGDDPHLLAHDWSQPGRTLDETTLERLEVPFADQGPCSIVPVYGEFLVLYGTTDGIDRCIGDRAALIDADTGDLLAPLRLPGTSRQLNSDGYNVTAVTTDGRVLLGQFGVRNPSGGLSLDPSAQPQWTTLVPSGALAASIGMG